MAHAVWWLFTPENGFRGWYVNLEHRALRGEDIEVVDHELDLVVAADRTWEWKDEQSFADKTGHYAFWTAEEAVAIRAGGQQIGRLAEAGEFPFDGSWCDFTPPSSWVTPRLPAPPAAVLVYRDARADSVSGTHG